MMPRKSGMKFMIEFVQDYLSGERSRLDWDLDFIHYLIQNYPKMEKENSELADCFNFYLAEQGFDKGEGLSDAQHKKLIKKQFAEFETVMHDGMF
jgi:hypothetical protein